MKDMLIKVFAVIGGVVILYYATMFVFHTLAGLIVLKAYMDHQ